jgi:hypothetical protein
MALSRRRKLVLLLVLVPLGLLVLLIAALFLPAVQTFAARKALADQGGQVERVAFGLGGGELRGLRVEQPGLTLVVPSLSTEAPLVRLARGAVELRSLVARDILVEIDPVAMASSPSAPKETKKREPGKPFQGVLDAAQLPELRVDGLDVAGRVRVLGEQPVDATFTLAGGGIRAGQTGRVELKLEARAGAGSVVSTLTLTPALGADGRLDAVGAVIEALANSQYLAQPANLRATADVARAGTGETYALRLLSGETPLVEIDTRWAPGSAELPGRWKIALRDEDLAPFLLGRALPDLEVKGGGELAVVGEDKLRVGGELSLAADRLEALGLPKLGPVSVLGKFAVEAGAEQAQVQAFSLDLNGASPVLAVRTRQPFTVAFGTRQIAPARADADLAEASLLGVPAEWVKLFVPELGLAGPVTGAWLVRPAGEGVIVSSSQPLLANGVSLASEGKPLVAFDSVRVEGLRATYGPTGFEATLTGLRVVADGADLVTGAVEASQRGGGALQAKGELRAQLAKLADQPVLRGQTRLSAGQAAITFEATLAEVLAAKAQVRLAGLRAAGSGDLPEVAIDADLKRDASGRLAVRAPLTVRNARANRVSDLLVQADVSPEKDVTRIDAKLSGQVLFVEDLQALAAVAADSKPAQPGGPTEPPKPSDQPLWAGVAGVVELDIARIVHAPGIEVVNTKGRVTLGGESAKIESLQAGLGTGGTLQAAGGLLWDAAERRYDLAADVKGGDVAVGPLLRALNPGEAPKLEGRYDLAATLSGRGLDPASAASGAATEVRLTGREGVLRAINLDTNRYARAGGVVSGIAGVVGAFGNQNSEVAQRANQITALNNVARAFGNLAYDEIALEARRAPDGSVEIGKLALSSSQVRLAGAGGLRSVPGRSLWELPLNLRLELGARGEFARYLNSLRLLPAQNAAADGEAASAGGEFAIMPEPLVFDGTIKQVGTQQVLRLLTRHLGL